MKVFNNLLTEAKLAGFKEKIPNNILNEKNNNCEQYQNLFLSMSEVMNNLNNDSEGNIPISKNEMELYQKKIENNEIFETLCNNKNLLFLSSELLNQEINELSLEIEQIEKENKKWEILLNKEKNENINLKKQVEGISGTGKKFLDEQLNKFKEDILNKITNKCQNLNKSIISIISELDYNLKKCNNSTIQRFIVGYRKLNNEKFDIAFNTIIDLLNEYMKWFEQFISSINNNEEIKDDFLDVNELSFLYEKTERVSKAELELTKNNLLKKINLSKEQYKNKLINDYILDNKRFDNEDGNGNNIISGYDLEKLIERSIENEQNKIKFKYTNIKNKYLHEIYSNLLVQTKQNEIKFIDNFGKLENIINSIYPYLVGDLNVTQEIFDQISEIIELYTLTQNNFSIKQAKLRKIFNESVSPLNKITLDDRDYVMLQVAHHLLNQKEDFESIGKVKIFEIQKVINDLTSFLASQQSNFIIKKFYFDNINNSYKIFRILGELGIKKSIIQTVLNYRKDLIDYEDSSYTLIDLFNKELKKLHIQTKNKKLISIYEAIYLFLFHRDLYKKEISHTYSISTIIKLNTELNDKIK